MGRKRPPFISGAGFLTSIQDLKGLPAEINWIAAVSQTAQAQTLMDNDYVFSNFSPDRAGFRRKDRDDAFRAVGREVAMHLPKIAVSAASVGTEIPVLQGGDDVRTA